MLNADCSMKRVFLLNFPCEESKLLAHDWAAGCLATAHGNGEVVTKKLSVTMASSFEIESTRNVSRVKRQE